MRRFAEAAAKLLLQIQAEPEFTGTYRLLIASYAHMGHLDDARLMLQRLREINPQAAHATAANIFRNPKHRELYLSGLRLAMGESE